MRDHTGIPCGISIGRRDNCEAPSLPDTPFPICERHLIEITRYRLTRNPAPRKPDRTETTPDRGVVYYLRLDDGLVKIGYTQHLAQRIRQLYRRPQDLLAIEPGTLSTEARRHREFQHLRIDTAERFRADPDLLHHIAAVREEHGKPSLRHPMLTP